MKNVIKNVILTVVVSSLWLAIIHLAVQSI